MDVKTDLHLCCSNLLKVYFLLSWSHKRPKSLFAAILQLDTIDISFSEDLYFIHFCCAHTSFSLVIYLTDVLGTLNKPFGVFFSQTLHLGDM